MLKVFHLYFDKYISIITTLTRWCLLKSDQVIEHENFSFFKGVFGGTESFSVPPSRLLFCLGYCCLIPTRPPISIGLLHFCSTIYNCPTKNTDILKSHYNELWSILSDVSNKPAKMKDGEKSREAIVFIKPNAFLCCKCK